MRHEQKALALTKRCCGCLDRVVNTLQILALLVEEPVKFRNGELVEVPIDEVHVDLVLKGTNCV